MKIAITGHANIEKALGFELVNEDASQYNTDAYDLVFLEIVKNLEKLCKENNFNFNELTLISGMARGVDEIFAVVAIHYNLNLILSIPGSIRWHRTRSPSRGIRAQAIYYDWILSYPKIIEKYEIGKDYNKDIPGTGNYPLVNLARNQHMVDIADGVVCYRVSESDSTGTDDCIKRAQKANKFLGNLRGN